MKDIRVRPCIAQGDLDGNMDIIMRQFAKTAFLFPDPDSIRLYDLATAYNYHGNAAIQVIVGEDAALTPSKSAETTDYTLTLTGEIPKLSDASKAALYGAAANQTHATVILIEVPTGDYAELGFARGATPVDLEAGDVIEINNRFYLVHVIGLYDNAGTVTTATTTMSLTYNLNTVSYAIAVSEATLQA
jgi:hypothetical protein